MRHLVLISSLLLLLSACAAPQPSEYVRTISAGDRWGVGAEYPVSQLLLPGYPAKTIPVWR